MAARLRILSKAPKFKTALCDSIISYYWRGKVIFDTERAKNIYHNATASFLRSNNTIIIVFYSELKYYF